ncbi:hypothetical protein GCM10023116_43090 [Kistimonas scapharcae]|uniref:Uncharacterized protein n=1 Tax=Kistimonas scapharcae TaxID=1036133 RepID=A0ABP8VAI1_9GAMM
MVSDFHISEQSKQKLCLAVMQSNWRESTIILHYDCAEQKLANYSQRPRLVQSTQYIVQIKLETPIY